MILLGVVVVAVGSYLLRALPMVGGSGRSVSRESAPVLRDAGMAGLAALTAFAFLGVSGSVAAPVAIGVALSALAGVVLVVAGRSMAVAVGGGLLVLAATWIAAASLGW